MEVSLLIRKIQEEKLPVQHDDDPLVKHIPTHLFSFEDKVFGLMTLNQLLSDIVAGVSILGLTKSLPFLPRLLVGSFLLCVTLVLVHWKVESISLFSWLVAYLRFTRMPKHALWRSADDKTSSKKGPSIQTTWIELDSLERGIAGYSEPHGQGAVGRYWAMVVSLA